MKNLPWPKTEGGLVACDLRSVGFVKIWVGARGNIWLDSLPLAWGFAIAFTY